MRNSSSLDWLRFMHTPNDYRVSQNKLSPTDKSANGWVVQEAKKIARAYLRKGQDFIWNATNITTLMRFQLINLFAGYGARVKVVYVEKDYSVWRKQNREREYPLPESVLDSMLGKLEVPQLTEAHEVEYLVENEINKKDFL